MQDSANQNCIIRIFNYMKMKTKTEKTLITKNASAIYSLELTLQRERPYYDELISILNANHFDIENDPREFREFILIVLRNMSPHVVDDMLLQMYGRSRDVNRVDELIALIKHYDLHSPDAFKTHLETKVYEYTQNENESRILTFLRETNERMIELGIAKKQRIELLETFGMNTSNVDDVRIWEFREQCAKCNDRVTWNHANVDAIPL